MKHTAIRDIKQVVDVQGEENYNNMSREYLSRITHAD